LQQLKELIDGGELASALQTHWMNRVTGAGFTRVPAPVAAGTICDQSVVTGTQEFPIAWRPVRPGYIVISAGGCSLPVAESPGVMRLLERLGAGAPQPVGPLIEECAALDAVAESSYLRHVLAELIARGAAELTPAGRTGAPAVAVASTECLSPLPQSRT